MDGASFPSNQTDLAVTMEGTTGTGGTGTIDTNGAGNISGANAITITTPGSGYSVGETVTITDGSGTATAVVTAIV